MSVSAELTKEAKLALMRDDPLESTDFLKKLKELKIRNKQDEYETFRSDIVTDQARFRAEGRVPAKLAEHSRELTKNLIDQSASLQKQTTKALIDKTNDLAAWQSQLERERSQLMLLTDSLSKYKMDLQKAFGLIKVAQHVSDESLAIRFSQYQASAFCQDRIERELRLERDIISENFVLGQNVVDQAAKQIIDNTEVKTSLEMDWSDKKEARAIDWSCSGITNGSPEAMFKPGAARLNESMSFPDQCRQFTISNINAAVAQREKSQQLIEIIKQTLQTSARQLRLQAEAINAAIADSIRVVVLEQSRVQQAIEGKQREIDALQKSVDSLSNAIKANDGPLNVALTRLDKRSRRPRIELCNDAANQSLLREIESFQQLIARLTDQLEMNSSALNKLRDCKWQLQMELPKLEANVKLYTDLLRNIRSIYPSKIQSQGFLLT